MQKGRDRFLFVETPLRREVQHVDPAEVAVGRIAHRLLDGVDDGGIGCLPQKWKQVFGFAHFESYPALLRGRPRHASEIARVDPMQSPSPPSPPRRRHSTGKFGYESCAR